MSIRKYLTDYQTVTTIDENGREKRSVVYHGPFFETSLDPEAIGDLRKKSLLLLASTAALHIGIGFLDNPGMYLIFVALPYVLAFFPLIYLASGVLRLPKEIRKYRRDEIGYSFNQVKSASRFLLAFLAAGILGEVIFLIFISTRQQLITEILFLVLEVAALLAIILVIKIHNQAVIRPCE
jgi:hypothetical protein